MSRLKLTLSFKGQINNREQYNEIVNALSGVIDDLDKVSKAIPPSPINAVSVLQDVIGIPPKLYSDYRDNMFLYHDDVDEDEE